MTGGPDWAQVGARLAPWVPLIVAALVVLAVAAVVGMVLWQRNRYMHGPGMATLGQARSAGGKGALIRTAKHTRPGWKP